MTEIALPEHFDQKESPTEGELSAAITADRELTFWNNRRALLSPPQTYALNALLHVRDEPLPVEQIYEMAGNGMPMPEFRRAVGALAASLFEITEADIVEVHGAELESLRYRLTDRLTITDQRQALAELEADHPILRLQRLAKPEDIYEPKARVQIAASLLKEYANHPRIHARLTELYRQNVIPAQEGCFPEDGTVTPMDCEEYFMSIEKGILAVIEGHDLGEAEALGLDMVDAYHALYYRHIYLVASLAELYRHGSAPYAELFQEGGYALLELITHHVSLGTAMHGPEGSTFTEDAHDAVKVRLSNMSSFRSAPTSSIMRRRAAIEGVRQEYARDYQRQPTFKELGKILNLTTKEIVEAITDPRWSPEKAQTLVDHEPEDEFTQAMKQDSFRQELNELLRDNVLTDREQIILSLRFGIFFDHLAGAQFAASKPYSYPYSKEYMPESALTPHQISQCLDVNVNTVKAILGFGLKQCRGYFVSKDVTTAEDLG